MQYMIPTELDIHNSLYQEFLCLILFWCLYIATGEKKVCTGKMTLLESVKMCVHRRGPACPPRRASQLQAGWSNEGMIFPGGCQAAAQTASPLFSLHWVSLHLQARITGVSGESGRALHLEALTPQGMGDTSLWREHSFGHLHWSALNSQRITFVTSPPHNTSRA